MNELMKMWKAAKRQVSVGNGNKEFPISAKELNLLMENLFDLEEQVAKLMTDYEDRHM